MSYSQYIPRLLHVPESVKDPTAEKIAMPYGASQGKPVIRSLKAIKKTYLGAKFMHALPGTFAGFR